MTVFATGEKLDRDLKSSSFPRPMSDVPLSSLETTAYGPFLDELRATLATGRVSDFTPLLDGQAGQRCFDLLCDETVQRLGAYFTPSKVARQLAGTFGPTDWSKAVVFDPACGAGDLLLPIAAELPCQRTVSATLRFWDLRLRGCDLSKEFIEAARLRLLLLSVERGAILDDDPEKLGAILGNLRVLDGLAQTAAYQDCTHVIMNPPFGRVPSGNHGWREGSITAAALFLERAARCSHPGTRIAALLPEVLRSGSSYAGWRTHVDQFVENSRPRSIGRFSRRANVDVFLQLFTRRATYPIRPVSKLSRSSEGTIGAKFQVAVGAVVPHRDPQQGPVRRFLHAGNAKPWAAITRISERRKFEGRVFLPPFVVVRRTSCSGEAHRAVASLVLGKGLVAVENHLLVLLPKRGGVALCKRLMAVLSRQSTSETLDKEMRCRHLTTSSVSTLPWA